MKRLVLIDGKSVFYRGYYAMGALSLSDGTPTGGVYGFAAIAMEIVERLDPTKVVVAWDSPSSTAQRKKLFSEYKAGRVKPGEDFYAQIPLLKELVGDLGWTFVELDDYEADDIIGTLSRQADVEVDADGKCEWETYIISSDLDMLQIVDENTHMWRILKGFTEIQEMDVAEVEAKYGILKPQFLDLKALKGDASDNIPGVPGVGEKTAAKLLNEYGTLDGIYEHLSQISGNLYDKLAAGKDSAYMSYELARIMFDAPVKLAEIPDFRFDLEKTVAGLEKLEFRSLIKKIKSQVAGAEKNATRGGLAGEKTEIMTATSGVSTGEAVLNDGKTLAYSKTISDAPAIIAQDVKALMHADAKVAERILAGEKFWDLGQAEFLLDPLKRRGEQLELQLTVPEEEYAEQMAKFEALPRLYKVLVGLDLPLIPVLYKMEKKGMLIDRAYFEGLRREYSEEVTRLEHEVWKLAGREFNLNSPVQLSEVLFYDLRLPTAGIKKTTRGYSTGAKELEKLKNLHPVVEKLMEYREAAKLLSTYILSMPDLADTEGRIHTTFTQNVTATGRLSSLNPNLQNIPVRTEAGKRIREGFVAPEGCVLVSADYSQFELRLAAVLAGDADLVRDFNDGVDIHTKTASEAFGIPLEAVTKGQRRAAKTINFGILYGMSARGLAEATEMNLVEAKAFIDRYFELRAPIKKYLEQILRQAREEGYVETYDGRRRPTPDVKSSNFIVRQAAERAAANMPIQGTEADLMKKAMLAVDAALPAGVDLVGQVHDSLMVECPTELAEEVSKILQEKMENVAPELPVKLAVEVSVGRNWGEV